MAPLIILLVFLLIVVPSAVRIVPQGQVFIRERLGRQIGVLNPGLHLIIPFVDRTIRQHQGEGSKSFQFGKVKGTVTYQIRDAATLRNSVADFGAALNMGAEARLKKHLGENLSQVSSIDLSRIEGEFLRDMVDLFKPWGVDVEKVTLAVQ